MRTQIPVPSKGDKLRATWGTAISNRVNELCAMAPAGVLQRDGFSGMGAQPLPQNLRNRRAAALSPGCWRLEVAPTDPESPETPESPPHTFLVACWSNDGGNTYVSEDIDVQDLIDSIVAEEGDTTPPTAILCAVFSSSDAAAELYADLTDLNSAQEDETKYILPLYVLGEGGTVITDLRNAPTVKVFEGTL